MRINISSERIALGILGVGLLLTFVVRIVLYGSYLVMGDDTGTYLATLHAVQGTDLSGEGATRPPLIGYFLWPFVSLMGEFTGAKIAALLASVLCGASFYLVARKISLPVHAAIAAVAFVWLPIYGETLGWGFLTLLALALGLLSLWSWIRYAEAPGIDRAFSAVAISGIMAYLNQTAVPLLMAVAGIAVMWILIRDLRTHLKYLLPAFVLLVVLTLGSIPYTFAHMSNIVTPTESGAAPSLALELKDPITSAIAVLGSVFFIYFGRKVGGPTGLFIMVGGVVTSLTQAITIPSSLGLITVLGRSILWFWMYAALIAVWGIPKLFIRVTGDLPVIHKKTFATMGIAAALIFLGMSWTMRVSSVLPYYTTLDTSMVSALEWIEETTPEDERIAAYPLTLAFYVNGVANRQSITTAPDDGETGEMAYEEAVRGWWLEDDRAVRCTMGYLTECEKDLEDLGVRYLITKEEVPLRLVFGGLGEGTTNVYDVRE